MEIINMRNTREDTINIISSRLYRGMDKPGNMAIRLCLP